MMHGSFFRVDQRDRTVLEIVNATNYLDPVIFDSGATMGSSP